MLPSSAKKTPPVFTYAGNNWLQSVSAGKKRGLGVLVENKLNMRQQCTVVAMKVYQFLDCICKNVGNRLRKEVLSPVFNICEAASGIPCSVLVPLLG